MRKFVVNVITRLDGENDNDLPRVSRAAEQATSGGCVRSI